MKEKYFTPVNIKEKAQSISDKLKKYSGNKDSGFKPEKSALLILDMQDYFLDKNSHAYIPSAEAIISNIQNLRNVFLKNNQPVIFTQHINTEENAGCLLLRWKDIIRKENDLSEITPKFDRQGALIIQKTQYDAFHETNLENFLKEKNISQIVITGVMTHLCCETTARSAFVKGFFVFLPIDGTATYNEDFHRSTFINLSHGFTAPILCEEIEKKFV